MTNEVVEGPALASEDKQQPWLAESLRNPPQVTLDRVSMTLTTSSHIMHNQITHSLQCCTGFLRILKVHKNDRETAALSRVPSHATRSQKMVVSKVTVPGLETFQPRRRTWTQRSQNSHVIRLPDKGYLIRRLRWLPYVQWPVCLGHIARCSL